MRWRDSREWFWCGRHRWLGPGCTLAFPGRGREVGVTYENQKNRYFETRGTNVSRLEGHRVISRLSAVRNSSRIWGSSAIGFHGAIAVGGYAGGRRCETETVFASNAGAESSGYALSARGVRRFERRPWSYRKRGFQASVDQRRRPPLNAPPSPRSTLLYSLRRT